MFNEILLYLALTAGTFGAGRAGGIPWDPDRTFCLAGACQQSTTLGGFGVISMGDKAGHLLGGAQLTLIFVAIDRKSGKEPCGRTVLRAALRTQVASAAYEVIESLHQRRHWGERGYGMGALDHLAVTIGSAALAGGVCFVRGL